jgi:hypothetical protein
MKMRELARMFHRKFRDFSKGSGFKQLRSESHHYMASTNQARRGIFAGCSLRQWESIYDQNSGRPKPQDWAEQPLKVSFPRASGAVR